MSARPRPKVGPMTPGELRSNLSLTSNFGGGVGAHSPAVSLSVSHCLQLRFTSLSDLQTMSKRLKKLFGRNTSSPGWEDSRTPPAAKSNHAMQPGPSPSAQGAGASLVKSSSYVAQILGSQAEAKAFKSQELPDMPTVRGHKACMRTR
jgi:hypothetical protein